MDWKSIQNYFGKTSYFIDHKRSVRQACIKTCVFHDQSRVIKINTISTISHSYKTEAFEFLKYVKLELQNPVAET